MPRRANNTHWWSGKRVEETVSHREPARIAECGDDYFMAIYATEEDKVTCPKCAAILAQRKIDKWNSDPANKSLAIERVIDPKATYYKGSYGGYRYAYKALLGGDHVGFIVMEGGYSSTHWKLLTIGLKEESDDEKTGSAISDADVYELDGKKVGKYDYNAHEFNCKERALLRVPALAERKKLRTKTQTIEDRAKMRERVAKREAEIEAENAAAEAKRLAALNGLIEIRGINSLSDEARAGLEYAIALISKPEHER